MESAVYFENRQRTTKPIDIELSQCLASEAQHGQCYENSLTVLRGLKYGYYVEGSAIFHTEQRGIPCLHGWLEIDGTIVDPYPGLNWRRYKVIYFPNKKYDYQTAKGFYNLPHAISYKNILFTLRTFGKLVRLSL